jgi:DNA-binding XRE family transcriptional regulator
MAKKCLKITPDSVILPPVRARRREKSNAHPLAAALAQARLHAGMTQEQLAADAGVGINSLRKIEQGDIEVNLMTLLKLVHYLDCDLLILPKAVITKMSL